MKSKKIQYKPISRQDISNPNKNMSHEELLEKAEIVNLKDNHIIEILPNGRIIVKAIDETKKFRKKRK